jgi:hypothetical protein
MLGKGLVWTPLPEEMAGLSRVGFAVHRGPAAWLDDAHNGHRPHLYEGGEAMEQAVIPHNGCGWGLSPTPEHALQAVLLGKRRQFGYYVPPTPYGAFVMVPAQADLAGVPGVEEWWHTDGMRVWREGGEKLTGRAAAEAVRASFEAAAAKLPFRAEGDAVFFHTLKAGAGRWRLYAIDPGWVDPRARDVRVRVQVGGAVRVRDCLSGEVLRVRDGSFKLGVPAGGLRILEAARAGAE